MSHDPRFLEYVSMLEGRVNERTIHYSDDSSDAASVQFREDAFTEVVLEILEELGQIAGSTVCHFERAFARGAVGKVSAWSADEDTRQLDLVTTIYRGASQPAAVTTTELGQAIKRAHRIFTESIEGCHHEMEPASAAFDMMQRLYEVQASADRLRIVILTDGIAGDLPSNPVQNAPGIEVQLDVWDIRRLYRANSSGLPYEPVTIDVEQRLGQPLQCLAVPPTSADYKAYVAILPGTLLHSLYHEYGPRLLELNVRSFLQARGKVNKGIRETLKTEPFRTMAYNNGISATAEDVELVSDGPALAIRSISGLQIVNGGQTIASIHRAAQVDGADLSQVFVQAKLTIVRPEHVEDLVPLISRYANTQNRVNEADFSANHGFHVKIQQLSEAVWTPGETSRWFYERARGQYEVAKAREGTTTARRKRFEEAVPIQQRFEKIDLAKFVNSWEQLPHIVSLGSQKNFVHFMDRLARSRAADWRPDPTYFRHLIAQGILFKRSERTARRHAFSAWRPNAVTYTLALLSFRTAGRVDLERIWNEQDVSEAIASTIEEWMPDVHAELTASAAGRNVGEWCKKEECWRNLQLLNVSVPKALEEELAVGQALPTVGDKSARTAAQMSVEDRENLARVMQVSPERWIALATWGARTQALKEWQVGIATTLATYASGGWTKVPSIRQAIQGVEIIRLGDGPDGPPHLIDQ